MFFIFVPFNQLRLIRMNLILALQLHTVEDHFMRHSLRRSLENIIMRNLKKKSRQDQVDCKPKDEK